MFIIRNFIFKSQRYRIIIEEKSVFSDIFVIVLKTTMLSAQQCGQHHLFSFSYIVTLLFNYSASSDVSAADESLSVFVSADVSELPLSAPVSSEVSLSFPRSEI